MVSLGKLLQRLQTRELPQQIRIAVITGGGDAPQCRISAHRSPRHGGTQHLRSTQEPQEVLPVRYQKVHPWAVMWRWAGWCD